MYEMAKREPLNATAVTPGYKEYLRPMITAKLWPTPHGIDAMHATSRSLDV